MKLSDILAGCFVTFAVPAIAWPGMAEMTKRIAEANRHHSGQDGQELIGDLKKNGATSPTGRLIADILQGRVDAQSDEAGYEAPGPFGSPECSADVCCVWSHVSDALTNLFRGPSSRCNGNARAAIRLGFHDAGTWSKRLAERGQDFGGADGSIILSRGEMSRPDNRGLRPIIDQTRALGEEFGVGFGDLVQFMAIHAVVTCPLGPRFRVFVGRIDSDQEAPTGLLPQVTAPVEDLIQMFEDKTISPLELIALVGAHSTSRQFFVDRARTGAPQDDTPGVWDTKFYNVTLGEAPRGVFKFESDIKLSTHPGLANDWRSFIDPVAGQRRWDRLYARAYTRLSLLGVNNINRKFSDSFPHCTLNPKRNSNPTPREKRTYS